MKNDEEKQQIINYVDSVLGWKDAVHPEKPYKLDYETACYLVSEYTKKLRTELEAVKAERDELKKGGVKLPFPFKANHIALGEVMIYGYRIKSDYSNNIMYMTFDDGKMVWLYDYETTPIL